jgi:hypothetical protein
MQRVFNELVGQLVEAFDDDIMVKSRQTGDLVPIGGRFPSTKNTCYVMV